MLTGERVFKEEISSMFGTNLICEYPLSPSTVRRHINPWIDGVVMKLLEKEPEDRYQTAKKVVDVIDSGLEQGKKIPNYPRPKGRGFTIRNFRLKSRSEERGFEPKRLVSNV
ncbi:MAG: hypothetical protein O2779_04210 [Nanoarchaeota archaeon]|nr:hypothetical protein [Nanoarchaeota archaeon]